MREVNQNKKKFSWPYHVIGYIFGICILLALIHFAGFKNLLLVIQQISPARLIAPVLIYVLAWSFRSLRLKTLTAISHARISIFELFKYRISGFALNTVLPAKLGDVVTIGLLGMKGISMGTAAAIIIHARILDLAAAILISIPSAVMTFGKSIPSWMVISIYYGVIPFIVVMGLILLDKKRTVIQRLKKLAVVQKSKILSTAINKLDHAYKSFHDIASNKKRLSLNALFSLMIWIMEGITAWTVIYALDGNVHLIPVILAVSIGNVGKSIPLTPGGLGIYETIFSAVLTASGVPLELATAAGIVDHALKKMFNLAIGVPAMTTTGVEIKQIFGKGRTALQHSE